MLSSPALLVTLLTTASAEVIDFTTDVTITSGRIDRLPGATVSQDVSGLYADGLVQFEDGAYNYYGANDLYITFDAPTGLASIDIWVLPKSLDHLAAPDTVTFEMTDAKGALIGEVAYTPTGTQDTVTLDAQNVTTLLIHNTGGEDFYGDGYTSAWYWIDDLVLTTCGDGVVDEACDDGGTLDGDGCSAECTVEDGYTCSGEPSACEDIDECADGTETCPDNATCDNTVGSYDCICDDGYEADGDACVDTDECADGTHDCDENATCDNTAGSYDCTCSDGYVGDGWTCEPEEDDTKDSGGADSGDNSDNSDSGDVAEDDKGNSSSCSHGPGLPALGWLALIATGVVLRRRRRGADRVT